MKLLTSLLLLVLLPSLAFGFCDDWRWYDTALIVPAVALNEMDREQTQWFLARPASENCDPGKTNSATHPCHRYSEDWSSALIGNHPSATAEDTAVIVAVTALLAATCLLDHPWREALIVTWIGVEGTAVNHNARTTGAPTPLFGVNLHF